MPIKKKATLLIEEKAQATASEGNSLKNPYPIRLHLRLEQVHKGRLGSSRKHNFWIVPPHVIHNQFPLALF